MIRQAQSVFHLLTITATLGGCSAHDSTNTQAQGGNGVSVGGLGNYDYPSDAAFGGYAGFASQPWASARTGAIGGASSVVVGGSAATGGSSSVTHSSATGGSVGGSGASSGGMSSTSNTTATGGLGGTGGRSAAIGGTAVTSGSSATGGAVGTGGSSAATGGAPSSGGMSSTGGSSSTSVGFDWGTASYDVTGGSNVGHQTHNVGAACLASCHSHTFQAGGTVYAADGTTGSANVQIGIRMSGTLYTTYSGSRGNFYLPVSGTLDWASAQLAIRTSSGTVVHPSEPGLSGNCNSCHGSSNRIIQP